MQLKVAKSGVDATKTNDPNDFIFHSDYNTFKIVDTDIVTDTLNFETKTITVAHGLSYIPLVYAFLKADTNDEAISDRYMFLVTGIYSNVSLDLVSADSTNIYFVVKQFNAQDVEINIKYYLFEVPL